MRTLDPIELDYLLDFITPDGWIFHSSMGIDKFNDFTERAIGIRLMDRYPGEGLSKGKTLRRFVAERGNEEKSYKLLSALIKYYEFKIRGTKSPDERPEEQFQKCREILKSYESVLNRSATNPDYGRIKEKFLSLYKDGAYWKQGDPAIGLAIALEPMTDLVRFCIANKIDGLFSNALFIRTLVEIQSLGGEGTKPQESQQAEAAWNTFISVLLPYITLFSKRKNVSLVEFKIFLDNHKQIYTNRNGFYRNINAEPIIGLLERCKSVAMAFHREHDTMLETMYAGVFADEWEQFDFLLASDKPAPPQVEAEVQMNVSITRDIKYRGEDKEDAIAEKVAAKIREQPLDARIVDVDVKSARKNLRAALKDPGGRPKKRRDGTKIATQGDMATSFGSPCTESKIANWEAYERTNGQRGSRPFGFVTKDGEKIIYSSELRLNPTPDNQKRLTALIVEFQSRHRIKDAISEKARHMKSAEALAKASGQVAAAIRDQSQLKYGK